MLYEAKGIVLLWQNKDWCYAGMPFKNIDQGLPVEDNLGYNGCGMNITLYV